MTNFWKNAWKCYRSKIRVQMWWIHFKFFFPNCVEFFGKKEYCDKKFPFLILNFSHCSQILHPKKNPRQHVLFSKSSKTFWTYELFLTFATEVIYIFPAQLQLSNGKCESIHGVRAGLHFIGFPLGCCDHSILSLSLSNSISLASH